jgi:hypothetical protein
MTIPIRQRLARPLAAGALALVALLSGGCFDKPEVEDRWTRIDVESSSATPYGALPPGTVAPITLSTRLTYRRIITGYAIADLRVSSSVHAADVALHPDAPRVPMAQQIDQLLANSVSVGRAARAITGWDHLVQHIDFAFDAVVPAGLDSTGVPPGLFLVCYLGSGEEIERIGMSDTLIVTPFDSMQYELLPVGMELSNVVPGAR